MEWTEKQILETLRFIEESDYDEVRLETGNLKLHVRKGGAPVSLPDAEADSSAGPQRAAETVVKNDERAGEADRALDVAVPAGAVAIRSPILGTFYRAPAPHLPPFVDLGSKVGADDTVCLIEVMKLFNTIKAGVSGTVVRILAGNGHVVKKDEILIVIEPR